MAPIRVTVDVPGSARVDFAEPVDAVMPGQAAVFYRGEVLLGDGWIRAVPRLRNEGL